MPFDATPAPVITDTPSLEALSYALRHPEVWPPDFRWNYQTFLTCGVGLSQLLWRKIDDMGTCEPTRIWAARSFRMPERRALDIFCGLAVIHNVMPWEITPEHVADAIDAYLASRG
jgi:hypothetical protein